MSALGHPTPPAYSIPPPRANTLTLPARSAHELKSVLRSLLQLSAFVVLLMVCSSRVFSYGAPTVFLIHDAIVEPDTSSSMKGFAKTVERLQRVQVVNLGPLFNGPGPDYAPRVSADGRHLLYLSNRLGSVHDNHSSSSLDLWLAPLALGSADDSVMTASESDSAISLPLNTASNEGSGALSADGTHLVFGACARDTEHEGCDLFECSSEIKDMQSSSHSSKQSWTGPRALPGVVNTMDWEADPSFSMDGTQLWFVRYSVSDDVVTQRHSIVLRAHLHATGMSVASVDTLTSLLRYNDVAAPFFAADGRTLFVNMTDAPDGKGHKDVVLVYRDSSDSWSAPVDAGPLVNSNEDDSYASIARDGRVLFFSSRREDMTRYGDVDIYAAFIPSRSLTPNPHAGRLWQLQSVAALDSVAHFGLFCSASMEAQCWICDVQGHRLETKLQFHQYTPHLAGIDLALTGLAEGLYTLHIAAAGKQSTQLFALKR